MPCSNGSANGTIERPPASTEAQPLLRGHDVFISYASQDAGIANAVVQALESDSLRCWIAPRDVVPGALYADEIIHAISDAKLLVLVLSGSAASSPHVGREVERAASKRRPIITMRIDSAPLTTALEYFLSESQWIELGSDRSEIACKRVLDAVRRQLALASSSAPHGAPAVPEAEAVGGAGRRSLSSLIPWLTAAVAALLMLGLARTWYAKDRGGLSPRGAVTAARSPAASMAAIDSPASPVIVEQSVAVLPFVDMSEKKDQEYFSDGLSTELIGLLTKIPELRVPARTSSFYYKGKQATLAEIAKELRVANVLEGSVRKSGNKVRVTAELIRVGTGYHLWSETYDRKLNDIFQVQDEIAAAVVKELRLKLARSDTPRSATTENREAYALYLQGKTLFQRNTAADNEASVEYLKRATGLDPNFAPAWAAYARARVSRATVYGSGDIHEAFEEASAAIDRALKLDPKNADAHAAHAVVHYFHLEWQAATDELNTALALEPNNVDTTRIAAWYYGVLGQDDEAIRYANRAIDRDPLGARNYVALASAADDSNRLSDAEAAYRKALELSPRAEQVHASLALVLLRSGNAAAALYELDKEPDEASRQVTLPIVLDALGRRDEADKQLAVAEKRFGDFASSIAMIYANRGEADKAFAWLDRSVKSGGGFTLKSNPYFKPLQADPRYLTLLRKMKFVR
jgi:TolB-like protein/Tfp pilus assembly protein PilF